jgi:hypothetical protein
MSRLHYWLAIAVFGSAADALADPLSVVPENVTISGPSNVSCSSGATARYYIYGGTPPYTVASTFPNAVGISDVPVLMSGGTFTAVTNGTCVNPLVFTITDSTGLQTTATLLNIVGTARPGTSQPALMPHVGLSPQRQAT